MLEAEPGVEGAGAAGSMRVGNPTPSGHARPMLFGLASPGRVVTGQQNRIELWAPELWEPVEEGGQAALARRPDWGM